MIDAKLYMLEQIDLAIIGAPGEYHERDGFITFQIPGKTRFKVNVGFAPHTDDLTRRVFKRKPDRPLSWAELDARECARLCGRQGIKYRVRRLDKDSYGIEQDITTPEAYRLARLKKFRDQVNKGFKRLR